MDTPARRQYLRIKKEHQDEILLFRMGDFYETFDEDAHTVSKELEIALTSREMGRGKRVPLAGIPHHALNSYLTKLIKRGYKVAVCEQTSDPATSRGLVDREVVRVVTPGTVIEDAILDQSANNYLVSVVVDGGEAGLSYVDITTTEFATTQFPLSHLAGEIGRLAPAEVLALEGQEGLPVDPETTVTVLETDVFRADWARESLQEHFGVLSLEPFGCEHLPLAIRAAGGIVEYLGRNQKSALEQIISLHTYSTASYMVLDSQTRRNLELFAGGRWGDASASLLSVLERTRTPMGGRLLRRWLGQPLLDVGEIVRRQEAVAWAHRSALRRERQVAHLESVSDIERLINKIGAGAATPRDLAGLASSLRLAPQIRKILEEEDDSTQVSWLAGQMADHDETVGLIEEALVDDPPASLSDGGVIRPGFSSDLDDLRRSSRGAQEYIASLEGKERERTGIRSLKVGFNKVFGYYIEVSKPNLAQVPADYIRRQTLVGGERYITPEMKERESVILNAQDRIAELEASLFRRVCRQVGQSSGSILRTARAIAQVDVFCSLADVAARFGYVRPVITDGDLLEIEQGRHPVVERMLLAGEFVPNDVKLSNDEQQLIILTGPNMAGKSTYIRQVAIIALLAQVGSFVPAASATVGVVDRIFTRVGLQDDLAVGQSTFMVEMLETAAILNHATPRSLIVLDEIGRGTSTYDGLAIARATAEYIHNHPRLGCKTLFATHYHELTQLAGLFPRVRNYNVAVSEDGGSVVFLRRIVPGGADKSYGVHVASLAGLPGSVVSRAWEVLRELEDGARARPRAGAKRRASAGPAPEQLPLLGAAPRVVEELLDLDLATITPLEAINKLYELQDRARDNKP